MKREGETETMRVSEQRKTAEVENRINENHNEMSLCELSKKGGD